MFIAEVETVRRKRILDFAQRMCFQGHPSRTDRRKGQLWENDAKFLELCLREGAVGAVKWFVYAAEAFMKGDTNEG